MVDYRAARQEFGRLAWPPARALVRPSEENSEVTKSASPQPPRGCHAAGRTPDLSRNSESGSTVAPPLPPGRATVVASADVRQWHVQRERGEPTHSPSLHRRRRRATTIALLARPRAEPPRAVARIASDMHCRAGGAGSSVSLARRCPVRRSVPRLTLYSRLYTSTATTSASLHTLLP